MQETEVVSDELGGRVDFVGDAGGQLADGLQFLGVAQLDFHLVSLLLRPFVRSQIMRNRGKELDLAFGRLVRDHDLATQAPRS